MKKIALLLFLIACVNCYSDKFDRWLPVLTKLNREAVTKNAFPCWGLNSNGYLVVKDLITFTNCGVWEVSFAGSNRVISVKDSTVKDFQWSISTNGYLVYQ